MSDIFREVDEEVRRSQAEAVWKRYGGWIIGACVLLVAGVGGWRYDQWRKEQAASAAGVRFEAAIGKLGQNAAPQGAEELAALSRDGVGGYQLLARFRSASEAVKQDPAAGIRSFDAIAADAGVDPVIRDMARLRAGAAAVDSAGLADVESRLQPLTAAGNAFRHLANELIAAAAIKAGDLPKAAKHLDAIVIDREAPGGLRSRAETLIGITRGAK
jgi:hypothetical protein